jgi:hypothetical protein
MSCCAPGAEFDAAAIAPPSDEELLLASRALGNGRRQVELALPAVHCAACIQTVEHALRGLPGVEAARVNLSPCSGATASCRRSLRRSSGWATRPTCSKRASPDRTA